MFYTIDTMVQAPLGRVRQEQGGLCSEIFAPHTNGKITVDFSGVWFVLRRVKTAKEREHDFVTKRVMVASAVMSESAMLSFQIRAHSTSRMFIEAHK